jgi:hypothetical protein
MCNKAKGTRAISYHFHEPEPELEPKPEPNAQPGSHWTTPAGQGSSDEGLEQKCPEGHGALAVDPFGQ